MSNKRALGVLTFTAAAVGLLAGLLWPGPAAGQATDAASLRDGAGQRVCLVTAQNALGVPIAYASGFLFGDGRFAVTDLASLAQPGVTQAELRFRDGTTAVATQFGMADPGIGLAAIHLDKPPAGAAGLAFSNISTSDGAVEATVVGWKWGQDLDLTVGRVTQPLSAADLAARLKMDAPSTSASFLNYDGPSPEEVSGSPVLDRSGGVLGVLLQVAGAGKPVVVPSSALRQALLSSDRQLKPIARLPKPVWPVATFPTPGRPATPSEFAQLVRLIKTRSRCGKCDGKGTVRVEKVVGTQTRGGITQKIVRQEDVTCPTCKGDGVLFPDGFYSYYMKMAENGTRLALAGDTEPKARDAAFSNCLELLRAVAKVGRAYREDLVQQAKEDLAKPATNSLRGVVAFAQVRDSADTADGSYVLLAPSRSGAVLAARADRMAASGEAQGAKLTPGRWIVLAGMVLGQVTLDDAKRLYVRPFAWVDGPHLGSLPGHGHPTGPESPPSTPTTPRAPGSPSFFGL